MILFPFLTRSGIDPRKNWKKSEQATYITEMFLNFRIIGIRMFLPLPIFLLLSRDPNEMYTEQPEQQEVNT